MAELGLSERVRALLEEQGVKADVWDGVEVEPTDRSMEEAGEYARCKELGRAVAVGGALLVKMFVACTASGASSDVVMVLVPEPMCMHTTVPVSAHACEERVPVARVDARQPEARRAARENATARTPRAALRRTSAAASSASHSGTRHSGMSRPPLPPHHSSTSQSLYASTQSFDELLVLAAQEDLAAEARVVREATATPRRG